MARSESVNGMFRGWRRKNDRVGVRNHVVILPLDDLSNAACEAVASGLHNSEGILWSVVAVLCEWSTKVFRTLRRDLLRRVVRIGQRVVATADYPITSRIRTKHISSQRIDRYRVTRILAAYMEVNGVEWKVQIIPPQRDLVPALTPLCKHRLYLLWWAG